MPDAEQLTQLDHRGVKLEPERISHISGDRADVVLVDGRVIHVDGLFTLSRTRMASPLAELLGCEFVEGPMGSFIKTDATHETSIAGVFACGDVALTFGSVALAMRDGARAGAAAHQSLVLR